MRLISSPARARTREALASGRNKNNPKDAQIIQHMLKTDTVQRQRRTAL